MFMQNLEGEGGGCIMVYVKINAIIWQSDFLGNTDLVSDVFVSESPKEILYSWRIKDPRGSGR